MIEGMAESLSVTISDQTCCLVPVTEPPLAGPHERWCGRTGVSHPLLPVCVPGMAQFLRVKVPPRVVTAKCSEPQAAVSNDRRGGSGVAKPRSLRTETGYKAKRWARVPDNPKPKG